MSEIQKVAPPTLLTVAQVRKHVPISERGIRGLIATGKLPVVRVGRRTFVSSDDLAAFVAACRTKK